VGQVKATKFNNGIRYSYATSQSRYINLDIPPPINIDSLERNSGLFDIYALTKFVSESQIVGIFNGSQ
jgi:hypothetical protein